MRDHIFDRLTAGLEILAWIEVCGMLGKVLTDARGHGETQVGVDVYLAHGQRRRLAQLLLRNTDSVGHLAAVFVDDLHELLRDGGRTVQHDGEAGQSLGDLFQYVKAQGRGNEDALFVARALLRRKFIRAVARADGDGERVAARLGDEFLDLLGTGVGGILGRDLDLVLNAGKGTKLSLDDDAVVVRVGNDLSGDLDILGKGFGGSIDHDGGEAAVDAALAQLKAVTVVEMDTYGKVKACILFRILNCCLDELHQVDVVGVLACALGDLQDQRCALLDGGVADALNDLHVVHVESTDGVAAVIGLAEHFF